MWLCLTTKSLQFMIAKKGCCNYLLEVTRKAETKVKMCVYFKSSHTFLSHVSLHLHAVYGICFQR